MNHIFNGLIYKKIFVLTNNFILYLLFCPAASFVLHSILLSGCIVVSCNDILYCCILFAPFFRAAYFCHAASLCPAVSCLCPSFLLHHSVPCLSVPHSLVQHRAYTFTLFRNHPVLSLSFPANCPCIQTRYCVSKKKFQ